MPGFGHRIHKNDPRTARLYGLAEELGMKREHTELTLALMEEFSKKKALPINVDLSLIHISEPTRPTT